MFTHKEKLFGAIALGILISQGFAQITFSFDATKNAIVSNIHESKETHREENIISDEVNLAAAPESKKIAPLSQNKTIEEEGIISDEVNLEWFDIEISPEIASLMSISEKSYALATEINENDLKKLFTENTLRFKGTQLQHTSYEDYVQKWETLQKEYNTKSGGIQLVEKADFIESYLHLSWQVVVTENDWDDMMGMDDM